MAADKMDIIHSSILDNEEEKLVEFMAEVDGDEYQFAVQYAVREALSGASQDDEAGDKVTRSDWPIPFYFKDQTTEVVYVDHDHLIRCAGTATEGSLSGHRRWTIP